MKISPTCKGSEIPKKRIGPSPDEANRNVTTRQISPWKINWRSNSSNAPMSGLKICNTYTNA
ncbi:MAG: hypothetical protein QM680_11250 [Luteolibacter sp.]